MAKYILKRLLMLIPIIIGVSFVTFFLMDMAPGNVVNYIGEDLSAAEQARLTSELGLDRSVFYRYFVYMKGLIHGDLGTSAIYNESVMKLYLERFPATVKLALVSVAFGTIAAIILGVLSAVHDGSLLDNLCSVLGLLGLSMPNFWVGLLLLMAFSIHFNWFPSGGDDGTIRCLILPAITIGTGYMAGIMRTTRSSMLQVLNQDYLRTARAKGVSENTVINKHALRNALIPIITTIGGDIGACLGGSSVTERVFNWPGVGLMMVNAITARDTNVVVGCIIMTSIMICIIQLIVDILYTYIDPRLRTENMGNKRRRTPRIRSLKRAASEVRADE